MWCPRSGPARKATPCSTSRNSMRAQYKHVAVVAPRACGSRLRTVSAVARSGRFRVGGGQQGLGVEAQCAGGNHGLSAARHFKSVEYSAHVRLDGALGEAELTAHLLVRSPFHEQREDLALTGGQTQLNGC